MIYSIQINQKQENAILGKEKEMYPKLKEYSFVKKVPEKDANIFSFTQGQNRKLVTINESASNILGFCDGTHSIEEIAQILSKDYQDGIPEIKQNINNFVEPFIKAGIIENQRTDEPTPNIVRGSSEIYLPNAVCWEITDYCPLDCRHCYIPKKNNHIVGRAEIERMLNVIQHMGAYQVQLTGGEALANPEFGYILNKLTDMKLFVSVSTSGFYSNDKVLDALENLKANLLNIIRISLDGNESTHNYIRRNDKAYIRAIKFIEEAVKRGINCQVGTCLINQTSQELEEMVKLVKQLGVKDVEIGRVSEQGNAEKNSLRTSWAESTYKEFLETLKSKYETSDFKIRQVGKLERKNCGAGYLSCRIKPNMDVTPCPMIEIIMGNLHRESIDEIMRKSGGFFYDLETPQEKFCVGCEKQEECKDCTAKGYNNKDKVKKCVWYQNSKDYLKMQGRTENF